MVVTAEHKALPGEVVGDIKPDIQLGPEDIQTYGVTAITDLLDQLAPEIRSDAGRGGEGPAILINGHRISDFREIRNLPTEALLRVDILPEEAALKYGFSANQRVINFVLTPLYSSKGADITGGASTAGGAAAGQAGFTMTQIAGDNRLILNAKYNPQASLTEADRNVTPLSVGENFDIVGNVTGAGPGGEIDPALSALAGRPITIAGVPALAATRPPALADFLPSAGVANVTDERRFRTLVPDSQEVLQRGADVGEDRPGEGGAAENFCCPGPACGSGARLSRWPRRRSSRKSARAGGFASRPRPGTPATVIGRPASALSAGSISPPGHGPR